MSNRNPAVQQLYNQIRPQLPTDLTTVTEAMIFDLIKDLPYEDVFLLPYEDLPHKNPSKLNNYKRRRANSIWGVIQAELYPGWTWKRHHQFNGELRRMDGQQGVVDRDGSHAGNGDGAGEGGEEKHP